MKRTKAVQAHYVKDGDSVGVKTDQGHMIEVRLYGIDAPERGQPMAYDAKTALRHMLGRKTLWLEEQDIDRYGRTVGLLYHQDQNRRNSINLRMVREGYAYAYTKYGGKELRFHQAEADARHGRRGVWTDSTRGGERPWDHRQNNRPTRKDETSPIVIGIVSIVFWGLVILFAVNQCT